MFFDFVIQAFRCVIPFRYAPQSAGETAETIEWKNWLNM
jgi:hypothetical protein